MLVSDQPVIDYGTDKKKNEKSMFGTKAEYDEMEALADAWKAQHQESMVGRTVNLSEFVKGKA